LVEVAVVLIPEEAEVILRMMYAKETHPQVHLITYASPVTRRMLPFNNLTFYAAPAMSPHWKAPQWLKTGLGLLAGRLHFEWQEYESLSELLGVRSSDAVTMDGADDDDAETSDGGKNEGIQVVKTFSPRPLLFLQEWLSLRRQGQDFAHTPMGFLVQDKPLHATHPLFNEAANAAEVSANGASVGSEGKFGVVTAARGDQAADGIEVDFFDGVDDMGANIGDDDDEEEEDDESEDSPSSSEEESYDERMETDSDDY
jgi:hypothetical protein